MSEALNGKFIRNEGVISAALDDELVLLSIEADRYFGSGSVGMRIWDFFDSPRTFEDLVVCLLNEFDVEESVCRTDAAAFVADLLERQLLVGVE